MRFKKNHIGKLSVGGLTKIITELIELIDALYQYFKRQR